MKEIEEEIWKDIPNFEGIYQVSSLGRLKSFKKHSNGCVLSNVNKKGDYFSIVLMFKDRVRYVRMHILVAEAFIPNPENKNHVHHIDENKQNNRVDNLIWLTTKEHFLEHNSPSRYAAMVYYNQNKECYAVVQLNKNGEILKSFKNCRVASEETGVCARNIHQVASKTEFIVGRVRKQAGGFIWKFEKDM